ncbi:MAG: bifunctional 4-hydroxy-2-oxoglutarate aldolase/2-dehydro-3-deoxy-phosphogluconate aldolase [Cellvibrionaceae bacterium]
MMAPKQSSDFILEKTHSVPVIPVLVMNDVAIAEELARVLVGSGLTILEVTLRTPNAFAVIEAMAKVEGAIVAAGTVLNKQQATRSISSGAQFLVSPGATDALIDSAKIMNIPLLPGVATASEIMCMSEKGFNFLKFFPAEINGGIAALNAFSSPFSNVQFCPTGGVNVNNISDYLSLSNVPVVGGSWLVTQEDLQNKDWNNIEKKVKQLTHNH